MEKSKLIFVNFIAEISEEAKTLGFIHSIEEFVAEPGTPIFTITNQA